MLYNTRAADIQGRGNLNRGITAFITLFLHDDVIAEYGICAGERIGEIQHFLHYLHCLETFCLLFGRGQGNIQIEISIKIFINI